MGNNLDICIIGGVAGGASAAARLRRLSEEANIIIIEKGSHVSFANCGLPYHIGGIIPDRNRLLIQTPQSLYARFNINVHVNTEAVTIDRNRHTVTTIDLKNGKSEDIHYDKLILSTGAEAFKPQIPGIDLPTVINLQTISDMDNIIHHIHLKKVNNATIIGGGFIGLECAENLAHLGIAVSIVEADQQVMPPLDPEMADIIHQHLIENSIDLYLGRKAIGISQSGAALKIAFDDNSEIETEMIILSIGVRPRIKLAKDAGLLIGVTGGISVDDRMRTSDNDIFAIGDAVEIINPITGRPGYVPLAGPANRQGRIVADQILGRDSRYRGTIGTSICKIFNLAAGSVGCSEKILKKISKSYQKAFIHAANHATYYPGSHPISIKLLFDPESGIILGAQAVGFEGVDKRIDVIATAIYAGLTVFDLEHLELSYSPPFGSAKDPINMIGFVAANIVRGDHRIIHAEELVNRNIEKTVLLDVRTAGEYRLGNIEGSINIPVNELRPRISELPRDKQIIIYCQVGLRGYIAQRMLSLSGYDAVNVSGGFNTWLMVNRKLF